MKNLLYIVNIFLLHFSLLSQSIVKPNEFVFSGDKGDGFYKNPIIFSDFSDPDVVRVGTNYYMTASSFNCVPGLPILHSKDLVNWKLVAYALDSLPAPIYDIPQHGKGCWAPSIRFRKGVYYIFYGDPDLGIFVTTSSNPYGPWSPLKLIKNVKGWIDPCPFWDDDGQMYLIHAWAKSRVGFNSVLTVRKMNPDNLMIYDDSVNVINDPIIHPTLEGPKLYKRNGYYYIFAPAGGVKNGWQVVFRSRNIYGPYDYRIVLNQGTTLINGPHQGAWIETPNGESWFIHFQEKDAYGRIIHLQPLAWEDDYPKIGLDFDGDGIGEPVSEYKKSGIIKHDIDSLIIIEDNFDQSKLSLFWQWSANPKKEWYNLLNTAKKLKLNSIFFNNVKNLWDLPNLLLQKFPSEEFCFISEINIESLKQDEISGLVVMGKNYSYIGLQKVGNKYKLLKATCLEADKGGNELVEEEKIINKNKITLKIDVKKNGICDYYYSFDGSNFSKIGKLFKACKGEWIGAKIGFFSYSKAQKRKNGNIEINFVKTIIYNNKL